MPASPNARIPPPKIGDRPCGQAAAPVNRLEVGQGEFAVSRDRNLLMTATLGSCVAVILHDVFGRTGGMTHIFQCVDPGPTGGAAVVAEIEKLINALMQAGSAKSRLEARIVGGARTLGRGRDVGGEIAGVCLAFIRLERVPLRAHDLGGDRPRRIQYQPATGVLAIGHPGSVARSGDTVLPPRIVIDPELF